MNPVRIFMISNSPKGSKMQKFLICSLSLITEYTSSEVHIGEDILFQFAFWNGNPPLVTIDAFSKIYVEITNLCGSKFGHYVDMVDIYFGKVIWKDPEPIRITTDLKGYLKQMLDDRITSLLNKQENIIQLPSSSGIYSIKIGYKAIQSSKSQCTSQREYNFYWNNSIPPRAKSFTWLALMKII